MDLASVDGDGGGWVGNGLVFGASRSMMLLVRSEKAGAPRPLCCIGPSGIDDWVVSMIQCC